MSMNETTQTKMDYAKELEAISANKDYAEKFPPSWKILAGETKFKVLSDVIKTIDTENGVKKLITVEADGQTLTWWLNEKNPAYSELIQIGKDNKTLVGINFSINRYGERKGTRYTIKRL